jgi:hypothetical protein
MEAVVLVAAIMLLFSITVFETIFRNNQSDILGVAYQKSIVCHRVADSVVNAYSGGPGSKVDLALPYKYNMSVFGPDGIIFVGADPDSISCNMPAGAMNQSGNYSASSLNLTNVGGTVVMKGG